MQIAFADIRFPKESGHKTKALCFPFGRHLAQQAPGQPNPVCFLERGRLFAERRSYSNVCVFNRPRSADRATFKCSRNLFPENRLSHCVSPVLDEVGLGAAWKVIRDQRHTAVDGLKGRQSCAFVKMRDWSQSDWPRSCE